LHKSLRPILRVGPHFVVPLTQPLKLLAAGTGRSVGVCNQSVEALDAGWAEVSMSEFIKTTRTSNGSEGTHSRKIANHFAGSTVDAWACVPAMSTSSSGHWTHHDRGNAHTNRSVRWISQSAQQNRAGVIILARKKASLLNQLSSPIAPRGNRAIFLGFFGAISTAAA